MEMPPSCGILSLGHVSAKNPPSEAGFLCLRFAGTLSPVYRNRMEAIALLLVWCIRISVDFDMQSKGRRRTRIRIRFGFGARGQRPLHDENGDE